MVAGAIAVSGLCLSPAAPGNLAHAAPTRDMAGSLVRYGAEDGWLTGGPRVAAGDPHTSGSGYVTGFTRPGAAVVFAVGVPVDGAYRVTLRYANGGRSPKLLVVHANGIKLERIALAPTGGWEVWASQTGELSLRGGLNTLTYSYESGGKGNLNLDDLQVTGGSVPAARGAMVPYVEYEAENARTNGAVIGPDRIFGDLASEASGRKAVTLRKVGQFVEFTLREAANGMVVRYSIPDSAQGTGLTAPLSLYVNGRFQQVLTLTSTYTWLYGSYPFTNNPAGLGGHHFYDETHLLFHSMLPASTRVRLQIDPGDTAPSYTIDLADFEQVPAPYQEPAGYLSLLSFGANPTGARDSTAILQRAVDAAEARHQGLYIPVGRYLITGHVILNEVTIRGAGPWYTVLHGAGVGLYGEYAPNPNQPYPPNADGKSGPSSHVQVYDLAIQGETTDRVDAAQVNGFGGHNWRRLDHSERLDRTHQGRHVARRPFQRSAGGRLPHQRPHGGWDQSARWGQQGHG